MTIIAMIIFFIGAFNWLSIGLLQYDFIAGLFGTQASIFSRLVYIIIGVSAIYISINLLKNKGKIILIEKKLKNIKNENQPIPPQNDVNNKSIKDNSSNDLLSS